MRNQEISACLGNVSYADVRHCAGCDAAAGSQCFGKIKRGLPQGRDPQAVPPAAGLQAQTMHNTAEERCTERSVLAQPTFVFGKKDHPLKRPAEDPVCKAENDFICSSKKRARSSSCIFQNSGSKSNIDTTLAEKRGRSSSFTILPRFPPSQPARKSNIFMTSALLQRNIDVESTKEGSLSESQLRNVIRPAILQPPQALTCPENPAVSLVTKKEAHTQLSEDNSYSSSENSAGSRAAAKSSSAVNISSSKTARIQLLEDGSVLSSNNSGFVFGENMVERVVSPEKHSLSCNEVDSYKREITSLYVESFHVTKTALLRNATQTEPAAAHISKPGEKILLDKVEVITGEEEEHNVLQVCVS
uniref:RAN binding protein 3 like n=1 Tax=Meleagris gallopavo TaxID=9103 RepID=A0A803XUT1_MELGA